MAEFEPSFTKGLEISNMLISDQLADPERVESYENEVASLEDRWARLKDIQRGNGTRSE